MPPFPGFPVFAVPVGRGPGDVLFAWDFAVAVALGAAGVSVVAGSTVAVVAVGRAGVGAGAAEVTVARAVAGVAGPVPGPLVARTLTATPTNDATEMNAIVPRIHIVRFDGPRGGRLIRIGAGRLDDGGCTIALAAVVEPENGSGVDGGGTGGVSADSEIEGSDGKLGSDASRGRTGSAAACGAKCTGGSDAESSARPVGPVAESEGAGWYPEAVYIGSSGTYPAANGRKR